MGDDFRKIVNRHRIAPGDSFLAQRTGRDDRIGPGGGKGCRDAFADFPLSVVVDGDVRQARTAAERFFTIFGHFGQPTDCGDHFARSVVNARTASQLAGVVVGEIQVADFRVDPVRFQQSLDVLRMV